jgi:hypothetical protein
MPARLYRNAIELEGGKFSTDDFVIRAPERDTWVAFSGDLVIWARLVLPPSKEVITQESRTITVEDLGWSDIIRIVGLPLVLVITIPFTMILVFTLPARQRAATYALWGVYFFGFFIVMLGFAAPLLFSFSPATEVFLRTTPIGFAKVFSDKMRDMQWVIHVGGLINFENKIQGGVAVPLLVVIFAMFGGVVNTFVQLPKSLQEYYDIARSSDADQAQKMVAFRMRVCTQFVYILSSPFLAVIVFCLLSMADYSNPWVLSVLAASVGFLSDQIVDTLLAVARGWLSQITRGAEGSRKRVQERDPTLRQPT